LKVGTAVVTRADGRLALGRLGALCEQVYYYMLLYTVLKLAMLRYYQILNVMQIKDMNTQGYEVIVVSSGAVGLGRQRLKYRRLVNSRLDIAAISRKKKIIYCSLKN
jgi:delta-1-pyrroline-5-carboxylate synthetase